MGGLGNFRDARSMRFHHRTPPNSGDCSALARIRIVDLPFACAASEESIEGKTRSEAEPIGLIDGLSEPDSHEEGQE